MNERIPLRRRSAPAHREEQPRPASPLLSATAILALQRSAGNRAVLSRLKLSLSGGVYARDDATGTIETRDMDKSQRAQLVATLRAAQDHALLKQVREDWELARGARARRSDAPDIARLDDLFKLGEDISKYEQAAQKRGGYKHLPSKDKVEAEKATKSLKALILELEDETLDDPGDLLRDTAYRLLGRLAGLTGSKELGTFGVPAEYLQQPVTAADIADYRKDTLEMGVFAGPAEAEALAQALHIQFDIFVVADKRFRCAYPNIGAGRPRKGRSLLFLGNHYVVLPQSALVEGAKVPDAFPVVATTEARGDCLYEGIKIVETGRKPDDYEETIGHMRRQASSGMSDVAVETAIMLIRSGSQQGLGSRMSRALRETTVRHLTDKLKSHDKSGYARHEDEINRLFKDYDSASQTPKADKKLGALEKKLAAVASELMPEADEDENPLSVPKRLFRYTSTDKAKEALKNGIKFDPVGGGIPTSTKGGKGIATKSGAVNLSVLLIIDTKLIKDFKFEYVPTRSKLKEVKIKCDVPPEAISKG